MKLSVRDAAKLLQISEREVDRRVRDRTLPFHRVGDQIRFHRAELLEWATSVGMRIDSRELDAPLATAADAPSFAQALAAGGMHAHVPGNDRRSVLRAVVERMPINEPDRDLVYDFLLAREALGSTGVGEGIAIPHVRNPIVLHVEGPSITLCFLERPVDYGAVDGRPVHTIFSVVSPTIRGHLFLLARIAAALHDPRFKRAILERAPGEVLLTEARRVDGTLPPPAASEEPRDAPKGATRA